MNTFARHLKDLGSCRIHPVFPKEHRGKACRGLESGDPHLTAVTSTEATFAGALHRAGLTGWNAALSPPSPGSMTVGNQAQKVTCLFGDNADPLVPEATPCQYPNTLRLQIFSLHRHDPTVSREWGSWSHAGLDNREKRRGRKPETPANTRPQGRSRCRASAQ